MPQPYVIVMSLGDNLLDRAERANVHFPKRIREHLGSNVESSRKLGWYWLQEAERYLQAKGK